MSSDSIIIGAVRASRDISGLRLAEAEYAPDLSIEPHPHSEPMCSVVLEGALTERWGRSEVECEAGTLTYLPPGEAHDLDYHVGSRCFLLYFGDPWTGRMRDLGLDPRSDPIPFKGEKANWLADQIYREFRSSDDAAALGIEGFALALLGEIARAGNRPERGSRPGWLDRAVEILHARMRTQVRMAEIAAEVNVHPTHLSRTFRERHGCTMGEYLRRLRIEAAHADLVSTDKSLSTIAIEAGFADQAHFTRAFKRGTGTTPGAWRRGRTGG